MSTFQIGASLGDYLLSWHFNLQCFITESKRNILSSNIWSFFSLYSIFFLICTYLIPPKENSIYLKNAFGYSVARLSHQVIFSQSITLKYQSKEQEGGKAFQFKLVKKSCLLKAKLREIQTISNFRRISVIEACIVVSVHLFFELAIGMLCWSDHVSTLEPPNNIFSQTPVYPIL